MPAWTPTRGDLIWLRFSPQVGHEQAGRRPALVLSPAEYNRRTGLMLCCPITSKIKGYPFEVLLPAGLAVKGAVLADQIRCLDWKARSAKLICKIEPSAVKNVIGRILALLHD
jgi:mRNA interferase MazF